MKMFSMLPLIVLVSFIGFGRSSVAAAPACFDIFSVKEAPFRVSFEDASAILTAEYGFDRPVLISTEHFLLTSFFGEKAVLPATAVNALQILNSMAGKGNLVELDVKAVDLYQFVKPGQFYFIRNWSTLGTYMEVLLEKWLPSQPVTIAYSISAAVPSLAVQSNAVKIVVVQDPNLGSRPLILKGRDGNQMIFMDPQNPQENLTVTIESIKIVGVLTLELGSY